jgi:hypothetical protein
MHLFWQPSLRPPQLGRHPFLADALIIAAPFSAIMMVGALVLVELTAGMIEQPVVALRNRSFPRASR